MTRRFFGAKPMASTVPGGSFEMGLSLSEFVVASDLVEMPEPVVCPECPVCPSGEIELLWHDGSTDLIVTGPNYEQYAIAQVRNSEDEWVFSLTPIGSWPIYLNEWQNEHFSTRYALIDIYNSDGYAELTATFGATTLGPITITRIADGGC